MEGWVNVNTTGGPMKLNLHACERVEFDGTNILLYMASRVVHFVAPEDAKEIIALVGGVTGFPEQPDFGKESMPK
jgi:hypothetical protein